MNLNADVLRKRAEDDGDNDDDDGNNDSEEKDDAYNESYCSLQSDFET